MGAILGVLHDEQDLETSKRQRQEMIDWESVDVGVGMVISCSEMEIRVLLACNDLKRASVCEAMRK